MGKDKFHHFCPPPLEKFWKNPLLAPLGKNPSEGDRRFNGLQNISFLVSSLAPVAKEQMTMFGRFGVHICMTFWVEVNVNKVYMSQATFFVAVAAYIQYWI